MDNETRMEPTVTDARALTWEQAQELARQNRAGRANLARRAQSASRKAKSAESLEKARMKRWLKRPHIAALLRQFHESGQPNTTSIKVPGIHKEDTGVINIWSSVLSWAALQSAYETATLGTQEPSTVKMSTRSWYELSAMVKRGLMARKQPPPDRVLGERVSAYKKAVFLISPDFPDRELHFLTECATSEGIELVHTSTLYGWNWPSVGKESELRLRGREDIGKPVPVDSGIGVVQSVQEAPEGIEGELPKESS